MAAVRERYAEAFWRAHHEAWIQGELNQREYCEAYGIPLKAFGNWRAKFKAEPQTPARKVLYRRGWPKSYRPHHPTGARGSPSDVQRERRAPGAQPRCGFKGGADAKHHAFIEGAADDLHRQRQARR